MVLQGEIRNKKLNHRGKIHLLEEAGFKPCHPSFDAIFSINR
jgi:hypothetical protein